MYETVPAPLPSLRQWRSYFKSRGIEKETIEAYINYIRPLCKQGVPVIFDWDHLGKLLGRTPLYLATVISSTENFYRTFYVPKRSGGLREIHAPYPSLLACQRWINIQILARIPIHKSAIGYAPNKSILDYVNPHLKNGEVYITDIKNFFPSISISRVIKFFKSIGYSQQVALALAKLCSLHDSLPQGAATSPTLSNLICKHMDSRLHGYSTSRSIKYSRYADDLCFSGEKIQIEDRSFITRIVKNEGFEVNYKKTRLYSTSSNLKIITGINIASGNLKLPKGYTRNLQLCLYHIEKHGFRSHVAKLKIRNPNYLQHLLGKVNYWLFVEPNNTKAIHYRDFLTKLLITTEL